ncbi:MAG: GatB/YqeY domain-containing protein [Vicinamibacteria bacterium]
MTIMERVTADTVSAMKAKDQPRVETLRLLKSELKKREIDKRAPLDEAEARKVIEGLAKQRLDSIDQFGKAGRTELVEKEQADLAILKAFLPESATDDEIKIEVDKAASALGAPTAKDMGAVMKAALSALKETGKIVDGKKVSEAVKARLA